jgi:pyridoxine/pyridoxamine 5'-phosphate oxidase
MIITVFSIIRTPTEGKQSRGHSNSEKNQAVSRQNRKLESTVTNLEQQLEDLKNQFNVQDHILTSLNRLALAFLNFCSGGYQTCHQRLRLERNMSSQTTTREKYTPELRSFALTLHF